MSRAAIRIGIKAGDVRCWSVGCWALYPCPYHGHLVRDGVNLSAEDLRRVVTLGNGATGPSAKSVTGEGQ